MGGSDGKAAGQDAAVERRIAAVIGKQPAAIAMGPPQPAQIVEHWLGSGTSRSLSPFPMMRRTWLARSTAPTPSVVASLMRRPHAYMTARHVLWTGLRIPPSKRRT